MLHFPALEAFEVDDRVGPGLMRAYAHLRRCLDFHEIRTAKRWSVDNANVTRTLNTLVAWGYLIEHPRGPRNERRFTLAYSVRQQRAA